MGRISSLFWPSSYLVDGSVVTIRNQCETYITACEDRKTVTLEKKLEGSNNGQHWTVKVLRDPDGTLTGKFNLKSIYGTFLGARVASSKWLGILNKYEVCQTSIVEEEDNLSPFYVHCWVLARSSKAHLNWYDLRFRYYYTANICEEYVFLVPSMGSRLRLVRDLPDLESWYIQLAEDDKKQQKPAPTLAPVPSTPTPTREPPNSTTNIRSLDSQPRKKNHLKAAYACKYLVNNINSHMGALYSTHMGAFYNTGLNTSYGSGTQNTGDIASSTQKAGDSESGTQKTGDLQYGMN
uniref:DUF569 domain-containing protein n=1 Tax=Opuntia streptacantha TaxID=393608 RepID=A0A7C9E3U0_OPUST